MAPVTGQSPLPDVPPGLSVLEAVLERITYANEDTGYTIARVATERAGPDLLTVVGPLLGAQVGESLRPANSAALTAATAPGPADHRRQPRTTPGRGHPEHSSSAPEGSEPNTHHSGPGQPGREVALPAGLDRAKQRRPCSREST